MSTATAAKFGAIVGLINLVFMALYGFVFSGNPLFALLISVVAFAACVLYVLARQHFPILLHAFIGLAWFAISARHW